MKVNRLEDPLTVTAHDSVLIYNTHKVRITEIPEDTTPVTKTTLILD